MAIDFSLTPELEAIRVNVRTFVEEVVRPEERRIESEKLAETDRRGYVKALIGLRTKAKAAGLWLPHMPTEWGGMGLGHVQLAMVQAEAAKTRAWALGLQLPSTRRR